MLHHYRLMNQIFSSALAKQHIAVNPLTRLGNEDVPSPEDAEMNTVAAEELGAFIAAFENTRLLPLVNGFTAMCSITTA